MAIPGVVEVGATNCLPLEGGFGMSFDILGRPKGNAPSTGGGGFHSV
jgi:putative ABC transport system permease protein